VHNNYCKIPYLHIEKKYLQHYTLISVIGSGIMLFDPPLAPLSHNINILLFENMTGQLKDGAATPRTWFSSDTEILWRKTNHPYQSM
jgi:hypothetical protein